MASVWALFFAWYAGVRLSLVDPAALFVAVWILYAGDRLLDAKPLFNAAYAPEMAERHRFHHAHRQGFVLAISLAVVPLMLLLHMTDAGLLHAYVLLACLLGAWLTLVHLRPGAPGSAHRLPKELAVGLFFPAATCLPAAVRWPHHGLAFVLPAMPFGLLCILNCLFVSAWEHPGGRTEAHSTARWGARHLLPLARLYTLMTATGALLLILLILQSTALPFSMRLTPFAQGFPHNAGWASACSLSGGLLLLLHAVRHRLRPATLRAAADLALLTPVPFLVLGSVLRA